jgi:DNA-binding transcriptional LysR family regulator
MTLEQLRIFVAVAERQHVTRAAEALNLTQSAVSGALAALEARHGVQLFDRVGRGVVLNEVGRSFLIEAKGVLARAAAAELALADMSALRRGRLSIYASQTIASYWLPKRLVAFRAEHPGVELDVNIGNTREAAEAVRDGAAELGFVEGEVDDPALADETVGSDQLVLLIKPDHRWAAAAELRAADLLAGTWVLREPGSGTRASLEATLRAAGVDPEKLDVALTLPSNEAVLAAAEAGAGATALSASVAADAVSRGGLVRANFRLPTRTYRLLRHKERYRTLAADAFVNLARTLREVEPESAYVI